MASVILIDTAGPVVGVAAFSGEDVIFSASERIAAGAEAFLARELAAALGALSGLDAVAVSVGPGTFTGVRVGVAAALGLALARGVDVVPLSSLAVRACLAPGEARVLSLLDARKGRVYAGWYDTRDGVPRLSGEEKDVALDAIVDGVPGVAVGEGAAAFAERVRAAGHRVPSNAADCPVGHAARLCAVAPRGTPESVGLRYLREPDARPSRV